MQATKQQKKLIHINTPTRDIKEEYVQWAMDDNDKRSTNDLTFEAANKILVQLGLTPHKAKFLAVFDTKNPRHKYILSLCIQYGWWIISEKYGKVADMDKLNEWMLSDRCPVRNKKLKDMTNDDLDRFIGALESMMKKRYR